ncbi:MAG: glycosyltransferase family 4 protein [Magnetococcales bacterium]|nr:glycosyltransferase family 4 protein [Magnetococcales bacterium]
MTSQPLLHILHTEASEGWGGQEIRILTEAAGLIGRGHRVELVCTPDSTILRAAPGYGVPVTALPIGRKNWRGWQALREFLIRRQPDVVVSHSSTDSWLTAIARLSLPHPPPLVRLRHISAPVPHNALTRWLYLRASRQIVTTGEALKQTLMRDNGYPPERLVSIPTGIDLTRFTPGNRAAARAATGLPAAGPLLGIIATLRSWKGHDDLLDAFALLARDSPHPTLVIVGDGPRQAAIEARIANHGLGQRVILAGKQTDVVPWLRALDIFVLPSYANEGVPQALMQAMACGLPVVTTPVGSIPEIIEPGVTGLLVPPRDPPCLARELALLLNDPHRRAMLGAGALAMARWRCGLEIMLDRMEDLLRRVVQPAADGQRDRAP